MAETMTLTYEERIKRIDVKSDGVRDDPAEVRIRNEALIFVQNSKQTLSPKQMSELISRIDTLLHRQDIERIQLWETFRKLKEDVIIETWERVSEEKFVDKARRFLYGSFDINANTEENGTVKKFAKWVIDGLIIGNIELAEEVVRNPQKIIDMLKGLFTLEGLKSVLKWLAESVTDLFSLDAYKTGKSAAELWLIAAGSWAAWWILRSAGGKLLKQSAKIGVETAMKRGVVTGLRIAGETLETTGKIVQLPYTGIKWTAAIFEKWAKVTGESIAESIWLKATKKIEKTWFTEVEKTTKDVLKHDILDYSMFHGEWLKPWSIVKDIPKLAQAIDMEYILAKPERLGKIISNIENLYDHVWANNRLITRDMLLHKEFKENLLDLKYSLRKAINDPRNNAIIRYGLKDALSKAQNIIL